MSDTNSQGSLLPPIGIPSGNEASEPRRIRRDAHSGIFYEAALKWIRTWAMKRRRDAAALLYLFWSCRNTHPDTRDPEQQYTPNPVLMGTLDRRLGELGAGKALTVPEIGREPGEEPPW